MDVISENLITEAEARDIIESKVKEADLKFEQKNTLEVMNKFVTLDSKKAKALAADLQKIQSLRDRQIVAIVDFLPNDTDDIRALLSKEYANLKKEDVDLILETVKKA